MPDQSTTKRRFFTTRTMVGCAVMTAVIAVLAQISIPLPSGVPITLQTFAVALTAYFLGTKRGVISVAVYILLGAVGVPVFAGFKGGIASIIGVTGGFIVGFLVQAAVTGIRVNAEKKVLNAVIAIALGIVGMLGCHLLGVIWFAVATHTPFIASFVKVSAPYLVKDVASVVGAWIIAGALRQVRGLRID